MGHYDKGERQAGLHGEALQPWRARKLLSYDSDFAEAEKNRRIGTTRASLDSGLLKRSNPVTMRDRLDKTLSMM
ncbi:unnamed protein product [Alternaria alternata]